MIRIIILILIALLGSWLTLTLITLFIDFCLDISNDLAEDCKYDGDCPCCGERTIMWANKEDTEIKYMCKHCGWNVYYIKNEEGSWRRM